RKRVSTVAARLACTTFSTLEQRWRKLKAASPRKNIIVDLCAVSFIDGRGKVLPQQIHHQGGILLAEGCLNQAIVSEILVRKKKTGKAEDSKGSGIIFYLLFVSLSLIPAKTFAQAPQPPDNTAAQVVHLTLDKPSPWRSSRIPPLKSPY